MTSVSSILTRITGNGIIVAVMLAVWWLLAAAVSDSYFAVANGVVTSWFGKLVFFLALIGVWYHYLAGLRHLYFDAGHGLEIKTAEMLGWVCIIGSVVLAILTTYRGLRGRRCAILQIASGLRGVGHPIPGPSITGRCRCRRWLWPFWCRLGFMSLVTPLGGTREQVLATFGHPFPAILTALVLVVAMRHFAKGATMMIEDYAHGSTRKVAGDVCHLAGRCDCCDGAVCPDQDCPVREWNDCLSV